ncbi:GLPGLI family protein [Cellulophaga lytica]|uniref:GLPGLI family protein n=1 Tax=Cellulophaga lytica (strain ATCC 23178 / DSM 7489 / JCM 8516 / NBRC 14961 / NCIMB 1423 / VKM B-1433 / Cy l20) TaxID=867900 RepID=F0RBE3_CELLC|nr:GLPGLI family protein [Cellulophaga lytica]ADY29565.1 Protein of unknown function, Porph ging [Cellulophaga lytica DSM 7489]WQG76264.1 GLPGLI family protein [Cellulophaga lytica]
MKNILLLILLPILSFSQIKEGVIVYKIDMNKQQAVLDKEKSSIGIQKYEYLSNVFKASKELEFNLSFNSKYSLFNPLDNLDVGKTNYFKGLALIMSSSKGKYYTSLSQKKQIIETRRKINFDLPIEKGNWKLTKETKKIGDFLCYKATFLKTTKNGNKTIIAWYSPAIPFAYGPNNYVGQLPGLILELNDIMATYKAKEIKLNPKKPVDIKWPQNIKTMSKDEYKKAGDEYYNKLKKEKR